ncbi:MAG: hypothetical protein JKY51_12025 [Opitutaceae bacterium]|nr:hypothetical protein [Opitutaceae bacterium]
MENTEISPDLNVTADEWNQLRRNFQNSIMGDTSLNSLSEDLGLGSWPIRGGDEVPAKYIDYTLIDLQEDPGFNGRPKRIEQLVEILRQTLAFDDPFGDMVSSVDEAESDNAILQTLDKLEIPRCFPLELAKLSAESRELCEVEQLGTVEEFARFAQNMAQHIVIGGDFRTLVNALANSNEHNIAKFIPSRPNAKGVHLIESVALLVKELSREGQLALTRRFEGIIAEKDRLDAIKLSRPEVQELEEGLLKKMNVRLVWFEEEKRELEFLMKQSGNGVQRSLMVLEDPSLETIVQGLLKKAINPESSGGSQGTPQKADSKWFGSFSKLFRKSSSKKVSN